MYKVAWVVGIPQSGKTTLAVARAMRQARERRCPLLAIDPAQVRQFAGFGRARSVEEAISALYSRRAGKDGTRFAKLKGSCSPVVVFTPRDLAELDDLLRGARAGKDLVLLVDEAHYFLSAQSGSSTGLVHSMREAQHARTDIFLTTQHLSGDIPQAALSCTSTLHVFRCTAPRVLRLLETEWGIARARVASLPQFHYLTARIGFPG